jgi:hypothetical protein
MYCKSMSRKSNGGGDRQTDGQTASCATIDPVVVVDDGGRIIEPNNYIIASYSNLNQNYYDLS